ncbi:MAG TPA: hypothetical protein VNP72_04155 [Longimicrobium sp.]|nr:hypothetical protein [Longimicrobium sp.]
MTRRKQIVKRGPGFWTGPGRIGVLCRLPRRRGDTEYLLSSPENARRLLATLADLRAGGTMIRIDIDELAEMVGLGKDEPGDWVVTGEPRVDALRALLKSS